MYINSQVARVTDGGGVFEIVTYKSNKGQTK